MEASIIVSVLLGLVEQIVSPDSSSSHSAPLPATLPSLPQGSQEENLQGSENKPESAEADSTSEEEEQLRTKRLVRKLRLQIFLGAIAGFGISLAIGAAFIAVWFTQAANLWAKSENLWEGIFSLIAAILIFVMGVTMLKMDRAKAKWKVKLQNAFEGNNADSGAKTGKWVLFILPFITVLREGMEAVIFVGGVALGQSATSIPIAAIVGITCGLIVGYIIYAFSSRTSLSIFLIVMTNFLLLIGAGLFSKAVGFLEAHVFVRLVGAEVDDTGGDGPGSYQVTGNVWHLDCCNPENNSDNQGWSIFAALFGWTNSASFGTVLSYVFYWFAVIATLVYLKWKEGRVTLFGKESAIGRDRRIRRENRASAA